MLYAWQNGLAVWLQQVLCQATVCIAAGMVFWLGYAFFPPATLTYSASRENILTTPELKGAAHAELAPESSSMDWCYFCRHRLASKVGASLKPTPPLYGKVRDRTIYRIFSWPPTGISSRVPLGSVSRFVKTCKDAGDWAVESFLCRGYRSSNGRCEKGQLLAQGKRLQPAHCIISMS